MKTGFELIARGISQVNAGLLKIRKTLTDAFLAAKRKVSAKVSASLLRIRKSVKALKDSSLSVIRKLRQ